mgnify:CR=1 FL=1
MVDSVIVQVKPRQSPIGHEVLCSTFTFYAVLPYDDLPSTMPRVPISFYSPLIRIFVDFGVLCWILIAFRAQQPPIRGVFWTMIQHPPAFAALRLSFQLF